MQDPETLKFIVQLVMALLVLPFAAVMWFLMRKQIADLTKLEGVIADHKLDVAKNYVQTTTFDKAVTTQKEDFTKAVESIFKKLDRIEDRINLASGQPPSNHG